MWRGGAHRERSERQSTPLDTRVTSRRQSLREATAEAHAGLDRLVGNLDTHDAYVRYLDGITAFRLAVEPLVDDVTGGAGLHARPILAELLADRADLDLPPTQPSPRPEPPATASARLGWLYVLEGSALGAKLLYRQAQQLGFTSDHGARHLALQAASLETWRQLLDALERAEPFVPDEAHAASNTVFRLAAAAFRSPPHGA